MSEKMGKSRKRDQRGLDAKIESRARAMIPGAYVDWCGAAPVGKLKRKPPAWRIVWRSGNYEYVLNIDFARRKDAEAALDALGKAGATLADLDASPDEGPWEWNEVIYGALQW